MSNINDEKFKYPKDNIPSRVKYYLLDYRDAHLNEFLKKYGEIRMAEMSYDMLVELFDEAVAYDRAAMLNLTAKTIRRQ